MFLTMDQTPYRVRAIITQLSLHGLLRVFFLRRNGPTSSRICGRQFSRHTKFNYLASDPLSLEVYLVRLKGGIPNGAFFKKKPKKRERGSTSPQQQARIGQRGFHSP